MDDRRLQYWARLWAAVAWAGAWFWLYSTTERASIYSWSSFDFLLSGLIISWPAFGFAVPAILKKLSSTLNRSSSRMLQSSANRDQSIGIVLVAIEVCVILSAATFVFYEVGPGRRQIPIEYAEDHVEFTFAMQAFGRADQISSKFKRYAGKNSNVYAEEIWRRRDDEIEDGLNYGRKVSDAFLAYVHPDLPMRYQRQLIRGYEQRLQGRRTSNVEMEAAGKALLEAYRKEF